MHSVARDTIMPSLADGLPPEVAAALAPEWRANEAAYTAARPGLLATHTGQWVAFSDGAVIAAGSSPVEVLHAAAASSRHPYVARVGFETAPCRMRRVAFDYDTAHAGEPLPHLAAEFRTAPGVPGRMLDRVIPDTGADATALPWNDCQSMGLRPSHGVPGRIGGVGGSVAATLAFPACVFLDGREHPCWLQAEFDGDERILGRDVLNRIDVLFRGPLRKVVINP
jgi:hypothetical protein